jgi:hypothetical protein
VNGSKSSDFIVPVHAAGRPLQPPTGPPNELPLTGKKGWRPGTSRSWTRSTRPLGVAPISGRESPPPSPPAGHISRRRSRPHRLQRREVNRDRADSVPKRLDLFDPLPSPARHPASVASGRPHRTAAAWGENGMQGKGNVRSRGGLAKGGAV